MSVMPRNYYKSWMEAYKHQLNQSRKTEVKTFISLEVLVHALARPSK